MPNAQPKLQPERSLNELPLAELWSQLVDGPTLRALLELARSEDLGGGDITSELAIPADRLGSGSLRARGAGVVAGGRVIGRVVEAFSTTLTVTTHVSDGDRIDPGASIATIAGPLRDLLAVERTTLNLLGHLCGVATLTRRCVDAVRGTRAVICDTRKTTPGMRALEKYAVRCGGGTMHRIGLHDAVLLKDNHLAGLDPAAIAALVESIAEAARGRAAFIEVEVDALDQLAALLRLAPGTIDIVLLDNMAPAMMAEAVAMRNAVGAHPLLEASGGIGLDSVRAVAESGVDRIAIGAITHSVAALDIGLDVEVDGRPDAGSSRGRGEGI